MENEGCASPPTLYSLLPTLSSLLQSPDPFAIEVEVAHFVALFNAEEAFACVADVFVIGL